MPSNYIGSNRSTALMQLVGIIYLLTIFPIVLTIGIVGGAVYMLLDVIMKLLVDKPGGSGSISSFGMRLFMWPLDQLKWIATGDGKFPFLP